MISNDLKENLISKIIDRSHISGLTHGFYNYPARFSPKFSRSIIEEFSNHGDVIFDTFMGGGTTIVEAISLGRRAVGIDLNELAFFVTKVKTRIYSDEELKKFKLFTYHTIESVNIRQNRFEAESLIEEEKVKYLNSVEMWRLSRLISLYRIKSNILDKKIGDIFRCALLKAAQWAIDNKNEIASLDSFRTKFRNIVDDFIQGAMEYKEKLFANNNISNEPLLLNRSVVGIHRLKSIKEFGIPKLVITSPPYPGVHILYHRWQVKGRKETSAPYWIANIENGQGESYYTFGSRNQKELKDYFKIQYGAFRSLSQIIDRDTIIVQLIAFSQPHWQLNKYLETMKKSGFYEVDLFSQSCCKIERISRDVPNRKWYTQISETNSGSKEVVLAHKLL